MIETAPGGSPWPLGQIQGFLLRGYHMSFARHLALSIADLAAARAFIANLTDPPPAALRITNALPWGERPPEYCLNIGFTWRGMNRLKVAPADLAVLQNDPNYTSFTLGAKARAPALYETPNPEPDWVIDDKRFDVLLSIWSNSEEAIEARTAAIGELLAPGFEPLSARTMFDAQALDDDMVYFGYRDGIAQPIIKGTPFGAQNDGGQDLVDPSAFMIGTGTGIYQAQRFSVDQYGCFGAFMVIRQDVEKYNAQVEALAPQLGALLGVTDPVVQALAVKATFCGRWPNGTPLEVFPINGNDHPQSAPPPQKINDFRYGVGSGMDEGTICPVGAHIRRGNMRVNAGEDGGAFQGVPSSSHRILRRAMPYQIPFKTGCDRHDPRTERGLAGLFLGTSLLQQYELVLGSWINNQFAADMTLSDPVIGIPDPGQVEMPTPSLSDTIGPATSCVSIKANAYLFYPGMDSIRTIALGPDAEGATPAA